MFSFLIVIKEMKKEIRNKLSYTFCSRSDWRYRNVLNRSLRYRRPINYYDRSRYRENSIIDINIDMGWEECRERVERIRDGWEGVIGQDNAC